MFSIDNLNSMIYQPLMENLENYKLLLKQLVLALLVLLAAWIAAKIVQIIARSILRLLQFDKFSDKTGITKFLESGGLHNIPSTTAGNLIYWVILFIGFTLAVNIFTTQSAFQIVDRLILYLPQALVGVFIFIIGMAFALFFSKILQSAVIRAGIRENVAVFLKSLLFASIAVFSLLLGLSQLKVSDAVMAVVINNILQYSFLGLAIAFGLGGRIIAADIIASLKLRKLYPRGSEIMYDEVKGVLKEIGLFDSLVYTEEGIINIPNSSLARKIIRRKV